MRPRIVFLVMSAVHPVSVVTQLAHALAPQTVLLHHDFSQTPDFVVDEPNVIFVPQPKRTGWGVWGFSEGIFHSIAFAVRNLEFDYLQLLSPTCLPIKPLRAFEDHVAAHRTEADFSCVGLSDDSDALMSVAYRTFTAEHSLQHRILKHLSVLYFGDTPERKDVAGVQLRTYPGSPADRKLPLQARLALKVTQAWARPAPGRHMFTESFRPYFGSAWFGAHRGVVEWMLERFNQPDIQRQFSRLHIPEELLIPTLLKNSGFKAGPHNHCIITFKGNNPKWLDEKDFEAMQQSPAYFARKFPVDSCAPIRLRVLHELVEADSAAQVSI